MTSNRTVFIYSEIHLNSNITHLCENLNINSTVKHILYGLPMYLRSWQNLLRARSSLPQLVNKIYLARLERDCAAISFALYNYRGDKVDYKFIYCFGYHRRSSFSVCANEDWHAIFFVSYLYSISIKQLFRVGNCHYITDTNRQMRRQIFSWG